MGLLDLFSASGGEDVGAALAQQANNIRSANQQRIAHAYGLSNQAIGTGLQQSLAALAAGRPLVLDALRSGFRDASAHFEPYAQAGAQAFSGLADAAGLNGRRGYTRATDAFRATPGYEFMRDEAMRGIERSAAAGGMLSSGNTLQALSDRAGSMADLQFGQHLDRLGGIASTGYNAASSQSALDAARGTALGSYFGNDATARAGLFTGAAGLRSGIAQNLASMGIQSSGVTAPIATAAITTPYQAQQAASQNQFGALMGGLNLAAGIGGSMMPLSAGGGSIFGNLLARLNSAPATGIRG